MVDIDCHYEGQTAGDTITVANSNDFGDFACETPVLGGGDITYDDDVILGGTRNLYFQPAGTSAQYVPYAQDADHVVGRFRFNFYFESLPSATIDFPLRFVSAANSTQGTMQMLTDGRWRISAGTNVTSTATMAPLTKYRVEGNYSNVTSGGQITIKVYNGLGAGAALLQSIQLTPVTTAAQWRRARLGKLLGSPTLGRFRIDDFRWIRDAATPDIGPYLIPPTCDAGSDQTGVEAFKTVTLTGSDNDSDGTVTTRTWRVVSTTNGAPTPVLSGSGNTRTFKAPGTLAGTDIVCGYKVTDNDAQDSIEDFMTVTVFPATDRAIISGAQVPMETQAII
jgi:hypothetical protein